MNLTSNNSLNPVFIRSGYRQCNNITESNLQLFSCFSLFEKKTSSNLLEKYISVTANVSIYVLVR